MSFIGAASQPSAGQARSLHTAFASKPAPTLDIHRSSNSPFRQAGCRLTPFAVILAGFQKFANECCPPWKSTRSLTPSRTCPSAPKLFGGIFDYDQKHERLTEVNRELEDPAVWNKPEYAQELGRERAALAQIVDTLDELNTGLGDCRDLLDMAVEENDEGAVGDVVAELARLEENLAKLEFRRMFSHEMDPNNAYLDIQAGSGGTEAQDWANILLRMYLRWADKRGFEATIMELSAGEVAGIKGATVHIKGEYAFGWLRTEIGVHRLVRKSPFDSGNRRHTSFCAIFVSPEIDDKVEIEINPADLRIDTYRSSGAGGQHVNTTDSAVRITHVPTNTVVSCQNERSQHANKDTAMKMLRAKLYEQEMQKRNAASQALEDTKSDIGWGHQIRSYVLDASRIKDLRTNIERSDCDKVLDGDIDEYLEASLKSGL